MKSYKPTMIIIFITFILMSTAVLSQGHENGKALLGSTSYRVNQHNFSNGGGLMTSLSGLYKINSSIAQIDAGHRATSIDGRFQFRGGFFNINNNDIIFINGFETLGNPIIH